MYHLPSPEALPETVEPITRESTLIVSTAHNAVTRLLHPADDHSNESIAEGIATALDLDVALVIRTFDEAATHLNDLKHLIADNLPDGLHPTELIGEARGLLQDATACGGAPVGAPPRVTDRCSPSSEGE